jgi:hypothetical protein
MKLGLDIHGVIDKYPEQMIKLAQDTMKRGGRVYLITGPPAIKARAEMIELMTKYMISKPFWNQIYSIVDWMKQKGIPHHTDIKGHVWALREHDWNAVKGQIAVELGLDLHIDDSEEYGEYFPPGVFVHMKNKDKKDVRTNVLVP